MHTTWAEFLTIKNKFQLTKACLFNGSDNMSRLVCHQQNLFNKNINNPITPEKKIYEKKAIQMIYCVNFFVYATKVFSNNEHYQYSCNIDVVRAYTDINIHCVSLKKKKNFAYLLLHYWCAVGRCVRPTTDEAKYYYIFCTVRCTKKP